MVPVSYCIAEHTSSELITTDHLDDHLEDEISDAAADSHQSDGSVTSGTTTTEVWSYTIITVEAAQSIKWLHNRMPAILETEEEVGMHPFAAMPNICN